MGPEDFTILPEPVTLVVPVPPRVVSKVPAPSLDVFKLGILSSSRVPVVIFAASKFGTRATSRVPVVIFAASKFGTRATSRVPAVSIDVFKLGTRATSRVPAVSIDVFKLGTRATSRVPDPILAALSAVSSEPSPKNEPAVTFPVTTTFEAAVNEVIALEN
jgi:hypothetical protein